MTWWSPSGSMQSQSNVQPRSGQADGRRPDLAAPPAGARSHGSIEESYVALTRGVGRAQIISGSDAFTVSALLLIGCSWVMALTVAGGIAEAGVDLMLALTVSALCLAVEIGRGRFDLNRAVTPFSALSSTALAFLVGAGLAWLVRGTADGVGWRGLWSAGIVAAGEALYIGSRWMLLRSGVIGLRIAVIGRPSPDRQRVLDYLNASIGYRLVGVSDADGAEEILAAAAGGGVDEVIIMLDNDVEVAEFVAQSLLASPVDVGFCVSSTCLVRWARPVRLSEAVVYVQRHRQKGWPMLAKRSADLLGALTLLFLLSPVLLLVAAAIRIESPGAVIFKQKRFGFRGRPFVIWKFRSMYVQAADATGSKLTTRDDDRVTRVGRFIRRTSLDELPQLVNILVGDLSFVGPRPHPSGAMANGTLYDDLIPQFRARYRAHPGLTGLAQCSGLRGNTDTERKLFDRFDADMNYVDNWSLSLDVKILLMTIGHLVRPRNAF